MNSNRKGKRGELAWRDELLARGFEARRGQQFAGGTDSPDVVCPALAHFHFEVKAVEKLNVWEAMGQAVVDSGGRKTPVLAHKRNRSGWLVTMRAEEWFGLVERNAQRSNGNAEIPKKSPYKEDHRPPLYGWADGNYIHICCDCNQDFIGDKRAVQCADCAYK